jgi:hypothetical protein
MLSSPTRKEPVGLDGISKNQRLDSVYDLGLDRYRRSNLHEIIMRDKLLRLRRGVTTNPAR